MGRVRRREAALAAWNTKVLGSLLARQAYEAGLAGYGVPAPETPQPAGLTGRLCRQADIEGPWVRHWCRALGTTPFYHRKLWEDCYILQVLWEAGLLAPGGRRRAGWPSTAERSDAQDARMARFTSGSSCGCRATMKGSRNDRVCDMTYPPFLPRLSPKTEFPEDWFGLA